MRGAITDANSNHGTDNISFAIPSTGNKIPVITVSVALPVITEAMVINGTTQPQHFVRLTTSAAVSRGLDIQSSGSTVRGMAIYGFQFMGGGANIAITGSNNLVRGNLIEHRMASLSPRLTGHPASLSLPVPATSSGAPSSPTGTSWLGIRVPIDDASAGPNTIEGDFIGTNTSAGAAVPNGVGVLLEAANGADTIGGNVSGAANVISGNKSQGIFSSASATVITANHIGTNADDTFAVPNGSGNTNDAGVFMNAGFATLEDNTIADNNGTGVAVIAGTAKINENSIYDNAKLGIDLKNDGVTPNDPLDADTGPNGLMNFPVITSAYNTHNFTQIDGTFSGKANQAITLQFFDTPNCDQSGFGQGQTLLTTLGVNTNASGQATFSHGGPPATPGHVVTATATDPGKNTSEFSQCVTVVGEGPYTVDTTSDSNLTACTATANDCSLRGAITDANLYPGADTINFAIPGASIPTVTVTSALPQISDPVTIDGITQPQHLVRLTTNTTVDVGLNLGANSTTVRGLAVSASMVRCSEGFKSR